MKNATARFSALTLAGAVAVATAALAAGPAQADQQSILGIDDPNAIEGQYIVVLKEVGFSLNETASEMAVDYNGTVRSMFGSINGFSAELSAEDAQALTADPLVDYVQQNAVVTIAATQDNPPSWGLDRIDQQDLPLDDAYNYVDSAGSGVTSYIIDTGIETDHPNFEGRAVHGTDTVDGDQDATDCNGHGTHVAGTVGGAEYGVAKQTDLVAVRVLDCEGSGTWEGVIAGVDWVTQNAEGSSVANMSLGGGYTQALNDAVEASIAAGVTYVIAAGNDSGANACDVSPASVRSALTVAASDRNEARASFSNIGACVDLFAPGVDITSAWLDGGENTISGTSMASPHVAGAAALYLGENAGAAPSEVESALIDNAVEERISDPGANTPNRLLNLEFMN